ncbi:dihydroorotate dehydrogenase B (NAD(+)), electron transfer subunit [Compostibacillus humi]|uniref:Dihydroorotate dehydrogenase B (NAD(+)), electron transfer subunit n=1 Tax=Compostibacillus humi TaxID=1245525 RepID=A0A8J2ZRA8_9BACI|nr:dihydroorotate dehydrogenase electron transfer subunit [Compostibacillus humi]GGH73527.1 dihydroorotate dehydrogenase B (NAD(+)), electron transfer subunit [Compostibacillus humi]
MKREKMTVLSISPLAKDTVEMVLKTKNAVRKAKPGQFLYFQLPGHTLRRPISIAAIDKESGTVTIIFKVTGKGTELMATLPPGSVLDAIGPNGNPFPADENGSNAVLLIGGGIGVPPLYCLGKHFCAQGVKVYSVLGFQSREYVFYEEKFRKLGETVIVTDDGSYGEKGFVTDVLHRFKLYDTYFACGPLMMLKAVTKQLEDVPGFISMEERMGCGIGACYACIIEANTEEGYKKICSDGPVFRAGEVLL